MTKKTILDEINKLTSKLIYLSLSTEQNFPAEKNGMIYISGIHDNSIALRNLSYVEIYDTLDKENNYNIKMADGALIQFMYTFIDDKLIKNRLTFFPSPHLEEYQNNAETYELDEIYADIISKNIVATPIRFDFDPKNHSEGHHPSSHLTIGQYKNCRIPVYKPLSPYEFINFILINFYNTVHRKFSEELDFQSQITFANCITDKEKYLFHLAKHSQEV